MKSMPSVVQSALEHKLPPKIDYGIAFIGCGGTEQGCYDLISTHTKFAEYPLIEDILSAGVQEAVTGKQRPKEALLLTEKKVQGVLL